MDGVMFEQANTTQILGKWHFYIRTWLCSRCKVNFGLKVENNKKVHKEI